MKNRFLLAFSLTCLLLPIASPPRLVAADAAPRHIQVTAKRFSYDPDDVTVKAGEPVVLDFTSTDVPHGIRFKELNLDTKFSKGKSGELTFTPTQVGDFVGQCSVFCGSGHGSMKMTLHVVK